MGVRFKKKVCIRDKILEVISICLIFRTISLGLPWDFPGSPVAKTPCSCSRDTKFDPWSGN